MPAPMPVVEKISQGSTGETMFKLLRSELGNGQQQIAPDGLNHKRQAYTIVWAGLTQDELTTVTTALDASGGWDYLSWAPHGTTVVLKWRIEGSYSWDTQGGDVFTLSCKFVQDFR